MENIYKERGYGTRSGYLHSLAEEYGVDEGIVIELANLLGESEDFDGLLVSLEDMSGF